MFSTKIVSSVIVVLLCLAAAVQCEQIKDYDTKRSFERDCDAGYSITCFKLDIVSFIEKMSDAREYSIINGITIVQDPTLNQSKNSEIVAGKWEI